MAEFRLSLALGGFGAFLLCISAGWWWLIFGNVVEAGVLSYAQAASCLAAKTELCRLAESLCTNTHLFNIRWYAPEFTWAAVALLAVALLQGGFRTRMP